MSYLSSYPRPSVVYPGPPTKPRKFLPLVQPPAAEAPRLPELQRTSPIQGFELSRHAFAAAYPRSSEDCVALPGRGVGRNDNPFGEVNGGNKEERKNAINEAAINSVNLRAQTQYRNELRPEIDEPGLWIAANRLVKRDVADPSAPGTTLVCVHANGFHKEMWETTLRYLVDIEQKERPTGASNVDEIWMIDIATHAESFALNEGKIGKIFDWADVGRDILSLLEHCLPADWLPTTKLPASLTFNSKSTRRPKHRRLVGVGHSVGGNGIVQAAHASPYLFDQLILVDAMTREFSMQLDSKFGYNLSASCIGRRDVWASRKEAREILGQSPYFQVWHPDVFTSLIRYGLVTLKPPPLAGTENVEDEASSGAVTLATPRWAEASLFVDAGAHTGWEKLEHLREDLKVHFIMAGTNDTTGGPERTQRMVWRPKGASNVIIKPAGHLIVQETPDLLAREMFKALSGTSPREQAVKAKL